MLNSRMTATARVEPQYVPVDDERAYWLEIRKALGIAETAENRRATALGNVEAAFRGKCLGVLKALVSAKLGLE